MHHYLKDCDLPTDVLLLCFLRLNMPDVCSSCIYPPGSSSKQQLQGHSCPHCPVDKSISPFFTTRRYSFTDTWLHGPYTMVGLFRSYNSELCSSMSRLLRSLTLLLLQLSISRPSLLFLSLPTTTLAGSSSFVALIRGGQSFVLTPDRAF